MAKIMARTAAKTAPKTAAQTTRGTLAASRPAAAMSLTARLTPRLTPRPTTAAARLPVAAATLLVALGLQGCVSTGMSTSSSPPQAQAYSSSVPAQPEQVVVQLGVVQSVRPTQISANGTQSSGF